MGHRITIADVAREAGVSAQTISRVINNKGEISEATRARVLEVIERLGYRPSSLARGLKTNRSQTLGLVVPDIANPFFAEIARGAGDAAHTAGYSLLLGNSIEDARREADVLHTLEEKRVDGVVLCSSRMTGEELDNFCARQPAVVLVNCPPGASGTACVRVDDAAGAVLAVNHLIQSGRRRIGFLAGPPLSRSGQERKRGYTAGLVAARRHVDPALIRHSAPDLCGGRESALALLQEQPAVDGLLCYNDLVAAGALQACADLGRAVPEDVAVVGCDDIPLAAMVTPSLTTLHIAQQRMGVLAVELLLDQIRGCDDACREVVLQPELVVRDSAP